MPQRLFYLIGIALNVKYYGVFIIIGNFGKMKLFEHDLLLYTYSWTKLAKQKKKKKAIILFKAMTLVFQFLLIVKILFLILLLFILITHFNIDFS